MCERIRAAPDTFPADHSSGLWSKNLADRSTHRWQVTDAPSARRLTTVLAFLLLGSTTSVAGVPPSRTVPLTPEAWTATDSIRFVTHLGRPALYINRGVALARKVAMENGVLELDVTATEATNFPGVAFPSGVSAVLQRGVPAAGCERDRGSGAVRPGGGMVGDLLPAVHQWPGRGPAPEESLGPYQSSPEYPWHRLRDEHPGVYESYADMEAGAWTTMRIEVEETKARLYVNGATQPCLVVNDLKNGDRAGRIALWPT